VAPDQLAAARFLELWLLILLHAFPKLCAYVSLAGEPIEPRSQHLSYAQLGGQKSSQKIRTFSGGWEI